MAQTRPLYGHADLARLLAPDSVAIVGATPRAGAFGERVRANLGGFTGRLHLVNAKYDRIGDLPCFPSIAALPEAPDCAVLTVGREAVEPVVEQCIAAGAGGAIVFASGYAETGKPERAAQQARLAELARSSGMPIIGPNCIGIANHAAGVRVTFMPSEASPPLGERRIGVISQSGALGFALGQAMERGVSVSHVLTSGNSCDVDMADYLSFLAEDPDCHAIALLFEGMSEPRRLIAAAERAWAADKPVIACKLATGQQGAAAALSHTGSLAGADAAYRAAFDRAGIVLVENFEALIETASFFAKVPPPRAAGIAVIATSGGAAIMAADKAEIHGVPLPQPDAPARAILEARIPEFGSPRNPCDITAQVLSDPASLDDCAGALLADDHFAALVVPTVYASASAVARVPVYSRLATAHGKPVINVSLAEWQEGPGAIECERDPHVPLFRSMDRCFAAIAAWQKRAAGRVRPSDATARLTPDGVAVRAAALLRASPTRVIAEREAKAVLALYGVPVVGEALTHSAEEAVNAAQSLGLPAVLKVESADLPHKTEAGVIRLNLRTADEVRDAYAAIMAAADRVEPPPDIAGVLVQPMVPAGVEIVIGGRVDPLFGPLVVVGLGGVFVELLQDSVVGLAPVSRVEAAAMLAALRGRAILDGFRGSAPVDRDALAEVVCRVSEFLADRAADIVELDINPLIAAGGRIVAVDALIVRAGAP